MFLTNIRQSTISIFNITIIVPDLIKINGWLNQQKFIYTFLLLINADSR